MPFEPISQPRHSGLGQNTKRVLSAVFVLVLSARLAHADLRYTTHVEVRLAPVPTTSNPAFTQIATLLQALAPSGDTRIYLNADAARVEPAADAGVVILFREDGEVVLDPATRTYWRMSGLRDVLAARTTAEPSFRRTGEFTTIVGQRAERVVFTTSLPLPLTPPPGIPSVLTMEGELWIATARTSYARSLSRLAELAGPPGSRPEGLVLRQILRNSQLGYEVEYSVTDVVETAIAPALFEIPADYREVSVPMMPATAKF